MVKFKYYAVAIGRTPGVYTNWPECKAQIHEFREPMYRSFQNLEEANEFVTKHAVHSTIDHSTPLLTSSKRGSSSSALTGMISQTGLLQREVLQA
ncbi:hypothetical protein QJS10_CPA06g00550 [Acorus calamus]|uniref:ribonuclease H n=1 Tax=Acorus calamus TaxID=4465 RepID=A0AAV9ELA1_ACOCL|nr:hypothetical protein QJS10_CPA06g00550 [Acorus calamus]